jgi:quercetin dioxygenase-like cupin family protein
MRMRWCVYSGPAENFTGDVRVEMLLEATEPSHASGGSVVFEAGARTAWHSHPGGQPRDEKGSPVRVLQA